MSESLVQLEEDWNKSAREYTQVRDQLRKIEQEHHTARVKMREAKARYLRAKEKALDVIEDEIL